VRCVPFEQVEGQSPHWEATGSDPRIEIVFPRPLTAGWILIEWESALVDPACRPVLTFLHRLPDGRETATDIFLHAAIFGRQRAVVAVPDQVIRVLVSPVDRPGPFGFRPVKAEAISVVRAVLNGLSSQPLLALHAIGAALIGRASDFRLLLTEAIHALPLSRYSQWKRAHGRAPDWQGLDRLPALPLPRLHVIRDAASHHSEPDLDPAIRTLISVHHMSHGDDGALRALLAAQPETDLVMFLPAGATLEEKAIPAMLVAAARQSGIAVFYGDQERTLADGTIAPEFMSGFDPLWTYLALKTSTAWCVRVGLLRHWLAGEPLAQRVAAHPLYRPLAYAEVDVAPPRVMSGLLAELHASWDNGAEAAGAIVPDASIIIPTRDRLPLLRACIESIVPTIPEGTEILVVDNDSQEAETLQYLQELAHLPHRRVVHVGGAFNFSRLCNAAARATQRRMLVFLNNDTTALSNQWLPELWRHAMKPDQGAIGARLFYPSGRVQHAGVIIGMGGYAGHIGLHAEAGERGGFGRMRSDHTLLAVTGACLAVEREKFEAVGGFDEDNLAVDLNDIDLCLRLSEKGWRTVLAAGAELVHHESASRGRKAGSSRYWKEKAYFAARWRRARRNDPYYHPALSLLLTRQSLG